jgi:hypothetical protein
MVVCMTVCVLCAGSALGQTPKKNQPIKKLTDSIKLQTKQPSQFVSEEIKGTIREIKKEVKNLGTQTQTRTLTQKGNQLEKKAGQTVSEQINQITDTSLVTRPVGEVRKQINDQKKVLRDQVKSMAEAVKVSKPDSILRQQGRKKTGEIKTQLKSKKEETKKSILDLKKADFDASWDNQGVKATSPQAETLKKLADPTLMAPSGDLIPSIDKNLPTKQIPLSAPGANAIPALKKGGNPRLAIGEIDPAGQLKDKIDSVSRKRFDFDIRNLEAPNLQTILSEQQTKKLIDSLGLKKFDSVYKIARPMLGKKNVGKDELLEAINQSFGQPSLLRQSNGNPDELTRTAKTEALGEAKKIYPTSAKLPDDLLGQLPPLSGSVLDERYARVVDSLRKINMRRQNLNLDDVKLGESYTKSIFSERRPFWDKTYVNTVVGLWRGEDGNILQLSPTLGYHFRPLISVAVGPSLTIQKTADNYFSMIGIRTFAKAEFWQQRAYGQVEYQVKPYKLDGQSLLPQEGKWLVGGGFIQSLGGRIGLNLEVLYRVSPASRENPADSPWVFRVGLSTIKSQRIKK